MRTEQSDSALLIGGGRMGQAVREFDWSQTALGPIETWPVALKINAMAMLNSGFPQALIWGDSLVTLYNDAFAPILGAKLNCLGKAFSDIWKEAWSNIGPIADRAFAGEATYIEDYELTIDRFGHPEQAYFTFCYSPLRDEFGNVRGFLDTVIETTEKVIAQRTARLLNSELAHRLQNTLAMVMGISEQTLRRAQSISQAQVDLSQRISALGRTHAVLTQESWDAAPIKSIVENSLVASLLGQREVVVDGPPVSLTSRQSLALALALNELVTNAAKYGALSSATGQLFITWEVTESQFRFVWMERNGPPVRRPTRHGFGSRLLEEVLPKDFGGTVSLKYEPEGLCMTLLCDSKNVAAMPSPAT